MTDVQDTKEVEDDSRLEEEKVADKYILRRGIDTSTPQTATIVDIGYIGNTNKIGVHVHTIDFDFVIDLGEDNEQPTNAFVSFMSEVPSDVINGEEINSSKEFDVWMSDDLRRFGFTKDSIKYQINIQDSPEIQGDVGNVVKDIAMYDLYSNSPGSKIGVKQPIYDVENITDEKFKISIRPNKTEVISWEFNVPFQVDIESHPIARFIESEGNGDINNLDKGGEAYIVHKKDLDRNAEILGIDTSGQWAIVNPDDYKDWVTSETDASVEQMKTQLIISLLSLISLLLFVMMTVMFALLITL